MGLATAATPRRSTIDDWLPTLYELTSPKRQRRSPLTTAATVPRAPELALTPPSAFDDIVCAVCARGDEPAGNAILLCDGMLPAAECDFACHQLCLPSPLSSLPDGEWLCPSCTLAEQAGSRRGTACPVTSMRIGPCFQAVLPPMMSSALAKDGAEAAASMQQDERRGGTLVWSPRAEFASWAREESVAHLDGLDRLAALTASGCDGPEVVKAMVPRELIRGEPPTAPLPLPHEDDQPVRWMTRNVLPTRAEVRDA